MKKLIAGFTLAFLASPVAQAWTGSIEDMRTMQANQSGPILRIKGTNIPSNGCCGSVKPQVRCPTPRPVVEYRPCPPVVPCPQRARHYPARSAAPQRQVVYRSVAPVKPSAPVYQRAQRVVSEKTYTQRVYRRPANTCPLR